MNNIEEKILQGRVNSDCLKSGATGKIEIDSSYIKYTVEVNTYNKPPNKDGVRFPDGKLSLTSKLKISPDDIEDIDDESDIDDDMTPLLLQGRELISQINSLMEQSYLDYKNDPIHTRRYEEDE